MFLQCKGHASHLEPKPTKTNLCGFSGTTCNICPTSAKGDLPTTLCTQSSLSGYQLCPKTNWESSATNPLPQQMVLVAHIEYEESPLGKEEIIDDYVEGELGELIPMYYMVTMQQQCPMGRPTINFRVCVNFKKRNACTIKDHCPLPYIEGILEKLAGQKLIDSLMDLAGITK